MAHPLLAALTAGAGFGLVFGMNLLAAARLRAARASAARLDALTRRVERLEARLDEAVAARPAPDRVPVPTGPGPRATARHVAPPPPLGPTLVAVPDLNADGPDTSGADDLGRRFAAIWEMADAGATPQAISRASGHPVGQVDLILGLRRQAAPPSAGRGRPRPS